MIVSNDWAYNHEKFLKEIIMDQTQALKEIIETNIADSDMVFGETRVFGDEAIIPVSRISYGLGGGGGKGAMRGKSEEGEGQGFGIGVKAKPIGYIQIKSGETSYRPILDLNTISLIVAPILGFALLRLIKRLS